MTEHYFFPSVSSSKPFPLCIYCVEILWLYAVVFTIKYRIRISSSKSFPVSIFLSDFRDKSFMVMWKVRTHCLVDKEGSVYLVKILNLCGDADTSTCSKYLKTLNTSRLDCAFFSFL